MRKLLYPLIIFTLLTLVSCTYDIRDNYRSVVIGTVVDFEGNPLEGIFVQSISNQFNLGSSFTDASGKFEFISLLSTEDEFQVVINPNSDIAEFTRYVVTYNEREISGRFDLGTINLGQRSNLEFSIINISSNPNPLRWSLEYSSPVCQFVNNSDTQIYEEVCYPALTRTGIQTLEEPTYQISLAIIANTTATFTYTIEGDETQTISIPLTLAQNTYEFTY